jgi:hypothetical protein
MEENGWQEMENPHWCQCHWHEVERGVLHATCPECGYVQMPSSDVYSMENLLMSLDGTSDTGPFWWHSATRDLLEHMSFGDLLWAVEMENGALFELIEPEVRRRLPRLTTDDMALLLDTAGRRWRVWFIAELTSRRGQQPDTAAGATD